MKHFFASLVAVALLAVTAVAQPYNLRGGFNGWGETPMNDDGDGTSPFTVGGLSGDQFFKVAQNDWASSWPGSDAKVPMTGSGNLTVYFQPGPIADGWSPAADRVSWPDPELFGWEIMGAFNGWTDGVDTAARQMTNVGTGLYSVDYTIATAGSYDFKFRKSNSWDYSIGGDFGNSAGNANVTTTENSQVVRFLLDIPNGRWTTIAIPEPTTMIVAGFGIAAAAFAAPTSLSTAK